MIENRKVNAMSTFVPPIKCQGIKTKLVPFIQDSLKWDGAGTWIEPFLGSGVVLFNIQPQRAIVGDRNEHIIRFYQGIQTGLYTPEVVRNYLEKQSPLLIEGGVEYYYEVRRRFNGVPRSAGFIVSKQVLLQWDNALQQKRRLQCAFLQETGTF